MRLKGLFLFLAFFLVFNRSYPADSAGELRSMIIAAAREQSTDSALMYCRSLLADFPDSRYAPDALFTCGECFYLKAGYKDAVSYFVRFIDTYPDSKVSLFAIMYLLRLAKQNQEEALAENLKKKIIDFQQLVLLFRDSKEFKYRSLLLNKYRVAYYIDRAEFYIDGELFEKILY